MHGWTSEEIGSLASIERLDTLVSGYMNHLELMSRYVRSSEVANYENVSGMWVKWGQTAGVGKMISNNNI